MARLIVAAVAASMTTLVQSQTLYQLAAGAPDLSTLSTLVTIGGLVQDLSSPGTLTVFAPNDAAFTALGINTVTWLTSSRSANRAGLLKVLQYHVDGATARNTNTMTSSTIIPTVNGQTLTVSVALDNSITINGRSKIVTPNNIASNGIAHIVDAVLLPTNAGIPTSDLLTLAGAESTLSKLVSSVSQAGLTGELAASNGPFTIFAPANTAFDALNSRAISTTPLLVGVLTYHVVPGRVYFADLVNGQNLTTVEGKTLRVVRSGSTVTLVAAGGNNATIVTSDVDASNGVAHVINNVLLPSAIPPPSAASGAGAGASVGGASVATAVVAAAIAAIVLRSSRRSNEEEM